MDVTFITIHDLSPECRTLYASDSIVDILGYSPHEVINRPCWDFFHPHEIPLAKSRYGKGVELDKAAVLSYCRMKDKDGRWIGCEVVFSVVHDVIVSCTSIYRRGVKSQNRAMEAPAIRRTFSSSPQDPRYHMLSHLSGQFSTPLKTGSHEPRSALFLNRYTRTLTIMYATGGLADILGLNGEDMIGKSFYYCIQQSCLQDAVNCLENAKANDSIAYLRFWYRDPRQDEQTPIALSRAASDDRPNYEAARSGFQERQESIESQALSSTGSVEPVDTPMSNGHPDPPPVDSRTSSGDDSNPYTHENVFGSPANHPSSESSMSTSNTDSESGSRSPSGDIELEAVVSCTSDGMVVVLRKASSQTPGHPSMSADSKKGVFAAPWSKEPILPAPQARPQYSQPTGFAPGLAPGPSFHRPLVQQPSRATQKDFMDSIREIGVYAWAIVGINGSLAEYGYGQPRGEAQPANGLAIWQPDPVHNPIPAAAHAVPGPESLAAQTFPGSRPAEAGGSTFNSEAQAYSSNVARGNTRSSGFGFGDPGLGRG